MIKATFKHYWRDCLAAFFAGFFAAALLVVLCINEYIIRSLVHTERRSCLRESRLLASVRIAELAHGELCSERIIPRRVPPPLYQRTAPLSVLGLVFCEAGLTSIRDSSACGSDAGHPAQTGGALYPRETVAHSAAGQENAPSEMGMPAGRRRVPGGSLWRAPP